MTRNNLKKGFGGRSFNYSLIENINGAQKFLSAVWIPFRLGRFPFRLFIPVIIVLFHSAHFLLIFALLPLSFVYPCFFATCLILFILLRFRSGAWHLLFCSLQKAIGLYY
jgi:hypothetical protein